MHVDVDGDDGDGGQLWGIEQEASAVERAGDERSLWFEFAPYTQRSPQTRFVNHEKKHPDQLELCPMSSQITAITLRMLCSWAPVHPSSRVIRVRRSQSRVACKPASHHQNSPYPGRRLSSWVARSRPAGDRGSKRQSSGTPWVGAPACQESRIGWRLVAVMWTESGTNGRMSEFPIDTVDGA